MRSNIHRKSRLRENTSSNSEDSLYWELHFQPVGRGKAVGEQCHHVVEERIARAKGGVGGKASRSGPQFA